MSSMADLASALGGGGQDPNAGAPPSDLGGGAPADPNAQANQDFQTSADALDAAEQALHAYIQLEPDDADRAVAAQCLQSIIKLKAKDTQDQMQGNMSALQRALVSNQAGGGGAQAGPPVG